MGKARGLPFLIIQRINRYGQVLWSAPGQARQVILGMQPPEEGYGPILLKDGQGGAFVAYAIGDYFGNYYDLYLQHFSPTFERLWGDRGIAVAADSNYNEYPFNLVPDGEGGVLLFYSGPSSTPYAATFVQRIDAQGHPVWQNNGKRLTDSMFYHYALPDSQGGAYLFGSDLGAQHISRTGEFLWPQPAVPIGFDFGEAWLFLKNQNPPTITLIGNSHFFTRLVAQQFSAFDGGRLWGEAGYYWMTPDSSKVFPVITENGKGGAFIFWRDVMQEMDSLGQFRHTAPITAISRPSLSFGATSAAFVKGLGAFVVYRGCPSSIECSKLYLQKISIDGSLPWGVVGRVLIDTLYYVSPARILPNESIQEALVFFELEDGIYTQRIDLNTGSVITGIKENHSPVPSSHVLEVSPNPFHHEVRIKYGAKGKGNQVLSVKIYDIGGRAIFDFGTNFTISQTLELIWKGEDNRQRHVVSGVYFVVVKTRKDVIHKKLLLIR